MDWIGLKADVESGKTANYVHLPPAEIDELARLALAGKALERAVRNQSRAAQDGGSAGLASAMEATRRALAAWDAAERGTP